MSIYQIIRFKNEKQQHYNVKVKKWETSEDRWSGEFEADSKEVARTILAEARAKTRRLKVSLHEII